MNKFDGASKGCFVPPEAVTALEDETRGVAEGEVSLTIFIRNGKVSRFTVVRKCFKESGKPERGCLREEPLFTAGTLELAWCLNGSEFGEAGLVLFIESGQIARFTTIREVSRLLEVDDEV
jgi:hypothetical protein